jgi:HEAT repeat protein
MSTLINTPQYNKDNEQGYTHLLGSAMRHRRLRLRALRSELSVQQLIEWIENCSEDTEAFRHQVGAFNDAVKDLIAFGDDAVEPLIERLTHTSSSRMTWAALWALREIGDRRAINAVWAAYQKHARDLCMEFEALHASSALKDSRLYDVAIELLDDPQRKYRAIIALGRLGDPRAIDILLALLESPDKEARYASTVAFGYLKSERAFDLISLNLRRADLWEIRCIISTVEKTGGEKAIHILETIINRDDSHGLNPAEYDHLRCNAITIVGKMVDAGADAVLRMALQHRKPGVRQRARAALARRQA